MVIIHTIIYFVRHAESPYVSGEERKRGLSAQGRQAALRVKDVLIDKMIDVFISSPYLRAILTIKDLADALGKDILIEEDLRERMLAGKDTVIPDGAFLQAKRKLYHDKTAAFPGGESSIAAQIRAIKVVSKLLNQYKGRRIVIGTHGDIMTLMLNHFDPSYDFDFWQKTTMPDIYESTFDGETLLKVSRLWEER
ncbi:histidine phosphatase family protein [Camelliibacillus cellulosilyticus]|uniref:Histidine phosphatase family protein n=1 Tax=Camelliibacillus cellulosilyticus TaxID=2174486 RepID=A0ABV9GU78_9BACL